MPVDSTHDQYDAALPKWERMRAVLGGSDSVKAAKEIFLPKLTDQDAAEYLAYITRAHFFNATTRTRDGFSGMIFRKPAVVTNPESLKPFTLDADLAGQTFEGYLKHVTDEVIGIGRIGSLIEWNQNEARPYVATYTAEQVINWRFARFNGRSMLALLVLKEKVGESSGVDGGEKGSTLPAPANEPGVNHGAATGPGPQPSEIVKKKAAGNDGDEFKPKLVDQIRVYRLAPAGEGKTTDTETRDGAPVLVQRLGVVCDIYRKLEGKEFEIIQSITPLRKGKPLPEIPFVFHGPRDCASEIERPPLEDIAETNLSHYRSSADLEHGRHFTGLPTAWVAGFPEQTSLKIGSSTAWVSTNPEAKAEFLEFTGQGLGALKEALEQKELHMAVLGARMLEAPKKAAETAEAMTIRASGEGSVMANIAASLSQSFSLVLKWALWWQGTADKKLSDIGEEVAVVLNTDFSATKLDAATIVALVKAWQIGALSKLSLSYVLKQGEFVHPDHSVEDEINHTMTEKLPDRALPPEPKAAPAKKPSKAK